jgi:restriction endonuclease Mrr
MSIPDYQSLMRPLLAFGSDGTEKNINDAIKAIADQFKLTDDERNQLLPSGKQAILANRVHWARTYLDKAGAIKRTRRSHFEITDRGKQLLKENPARVDVKVLKQFPEFVAFQTPKAAHETGNDLVASATTELPESAVTPEEAIQQAEAQIFENLKSQLLVRIWELSPSFAGRKAYYFQQRRSIGLLSVYWDDKAERGMGKGHRCVGQQTKVHSTNPEDGSWACSANGTRADRSTNINYASVLSIKTLR